MLNLGTKVIIAKNSKLLFKHTIFLIIILIDNWLIVLNSKTY